MNTLQFNLGKIEMALTVKQLIAQLKKHDPNAEVAWQNHDQSENECDGFVGSVNEADESLLEIYEKPAIVVLRA